jgi:hypothetical protein
VISSHTSQSKVNGRLPLLDEKAAMPTSIPVQYGIKAEPTRVRMLVTPAQADEWLKGNTKNRNLAPTVAEGYATDMREKRWQYNYQAILIAYDGTIIDGQHRLRACVMAGVPFETDVVFGADKETMHSVDINYPRSAAHIAQLDGVQNAAAAAALAKLILHHRHHGIHTLNNPSKTPTKTQINAELRRDPRISEVAGKSATFYRIMKPSVGLFCYFLFSEQDIELADRFFDELMHGENLSRTSAVYHLRERLIQEKSAKAKLPPVHLIAMFFRAWIAYRENRPMRILKTWRADGPAPEAFPVIDNWKRGV